MTNEEAKTLLNSSIKYNIKKNNKQIISNAIYPSARYISLANIVAAIPGGLAYLATKSYDLGIVFHSMASIMAIYGSALIISEADLPDLQSKEKIILLKQYRDELKNGVNRFQNVNVEDFDKTIEENMTKKLK